MEIFLIPHIISHMLYSILPIPLLEHDNNNSNDLISFGKSEFTNNLLKTLKEFLFDLLQTYSDNWNINNLYDKIAKMTIYFNIFCCTNFYKITNNNLIIENFHCTNLRL